MLTYDLAVVGAGLAGLTAARRAAAAGWSVVVVDKGRGPGGRMSTRRAGPFDQGAQYFTARGPKFRAAVQAWAQAGWIAKWPLHLGVRDAQGLHEKPDDETRWVGVPGMSTPIAALATSLDVNFGTSIRRLVEHDNSFTLWSDDGTVATARRCIVTIPAPQAATLLDPVAPRLAARARTVEMAPCWAAAFEFESTVDVPFDGIFVNEGPLRWVARDSSKPGRPPGERWVAHAGPTWSQTHLEWSPSAVLTPLLDALSQAMQVNLPGLESVMAHRWRYALSPQPLHCGALTDPALPNLAVAGDWCAGARIEGAFDSGHAAFEALT